MAVKEGGEMCVHTVTVEAEDRGREQDMGSLGCITEGACIFSESGGVGQGLERFEVGVIQL